jgi:acetyl-CoA carboxylase carboxyltransferase component
VFSIVRAVAEAGVPQQSVMPRKTIGAGKQFLISSGSIEL